MNIAVFDNCAFKFSMPIIDHWRLKGHDVRFEMGSNPELGAWADLIFIDFLDQNFYCFFNGPLGDHQAEGWEPYPKKRIAVRGIDIDLFQYRHVDPKIWPYMDDFITISKWWYDRVYKATTPHSDGKLHLIKPGVDLDKFVFKDKPRGYKIAHVVGSIWEAKGTFEAIRIFQEVNRLYPDKPWELYIRGQHTMPDWHDIAYAQLIKNTGIEDRIFIVPQVDDMPEWYANMDYTLVTSHKEAFSYAAAEGMAVGLKPVINNFFGSDDIWPDKYRFSSIHEAVEMIGGGDWNQQEYRQYIQDNYDLNRMLAEYDALFGT